MEEIRITTEYIKLDALLKLCGVVITYRTDTCR